MNMYKLNVSRRVITGLSLKATRTISYAELTAKVRDSKILVDMAISPPVEMRVCFVKAPEHDRQRSEARC